MFFIEKIKNSVDINRKKPFRTRWDADIELNTTGVITVQSSAGASGDITLRDFDVAADAQYLVVSYQASLGEYWLTIRLAKAVADGLVTLPAGGWPGLQTVSVEIASGPQGLERGKRLQLPSSN